YATKDSKTGIPRGFSTPSKRIEVYCQVFKDYGYNPLPDYREPAVSTSERYPLLIIGEKLLEYCHGWGRVLPSLRKRVPHPFVEINPIAARERGIKNGEWVIIETDNGSIKVKAKLTDTTAPDVVCTQHGWWQGCPSLELPEYDPYSSSGANANVLYSSMFADPISGSLPIKVCPCNVRKL
ncbi:molybdopterin dinucleotide binding domain-containing protein, partial [Chloroflexota bacterium]